MPTGALPLIQYLENAKEVKTLMKKYDKIMESFNLLTYSKSGLQGILTTKMDKNGEYIGAPIVDAIKAAITEMQSEYRAADTVPSEKKDWWKLNLRDARRKKTSSYWPMKSKLGTTKGKFCLGNRSSLTLITRRDSTLAESVMR